MRQLDPYGQIPKFGDTCRPSDYMKPHALADIEPNKSKIDEPGDVNGWYRALCDAIRDNEIFYIYSILDDDRTTQYGYLPHPDTVITREDLNRFSTSRNLRRAFLS